MGPERTAFDVWLSQALRAGRDAVMAEPMPDEWLRLVSGSPRAAGDPDPNRRAGPGPGPCAAAPPRLRSVGVGGPAAA